MPVRGIAPPTVLKLKGSGSAGSDTHLVGLTATMQTVSFSVPVKTIKLSSPGNPSVCVLVVDDIQYS